MLQRYPLSNKDGNQISPLSTLQIRADFILDSFKSKYLNQIIFYFLIHKNL
jgi:hypothetical protein